MENIPLLLENGANIYAFDPIGVEHVKKLYPEGANGNGSITYVDQIEDALIDANICFIFTEWGKIKLVKPATYKKFMKTPLVYDGRNIYSVEEMIEEGVEYYSIGRSPSLIARSFITDKLQGKRHVTVHNQNNGGNNGIRSIRYRHKLLSDGSSGLHRELLIKEAP